MKSKKSIFVVALAALMLIAFTACEQAVPGLSTVVRSAEIVQTGVFLEGQPFDASKFSVNVTYTDGSNGTLNGVNVLYDGDASSVENGEQVRIVLPTAAPNYSGSNVVTRDTTFYGSLIAYKIDSLTVTGPTDAITTSETTGTAKVSVKNSDFTVIANYRDSQGVAQTMTLVADADYTVEATLDKTISASEPNGTATATVTLKFGDTAAKTPAGNEVTIDVSYVPATTPAYDEFDWYNEALVARIVPASNSVKYFEGGLFDGDAMIELYRVYTADDTAFSTSLPAEYYLEKVDNADVEYTLSADDSLKDDDDEVITPVRFGTNLSGSADVTFVYEYVKDSDAAYGLKTPVDEIVGMISGDLTTDSEGRIIAAETYKQATTATNITISDIKVDYVTALKAEAIGTNPYLVGWVAKDEFFKVTATYVSGLTKELTATTDFVVDDTPVKAGQTSIEITLAGTELSTSEQYKGAVTKTTAAIKVQAEDYPSEITVSWKTAAPTEADVAISQESFNFNVTWASGKSYTSDAPEIKYSVSPNASVVGANAVKIGWSCNNVSGTLEGGVLNFTVSE